MLRTEEEQREYTVHLTKVHDELEENGLLQNIAWLFPFMERHGLSDEDIIKGGGWVPLIANMVPAKYPTVDDLVEAIKEVV